VSAAVPFPDGWIELSPKSFKFRPNFELQYTAVVVDVVGDPIHGAPVFFTIGDTTVATLSGVGLAHGLRAGAVPVTATSGSRSGSATLEVTGMTRVWNGSLSTDWTNAANWDGPVVPVSADSVLIPNPAAGPHYPVLVDNRTIVGVTVANGATISLGPFDLTATGNVFTGTSGGISSSVGRLILAGSARTVQGILPRLRVPGSYSLTGNVTARAPVQVDLGRITNSSFRIQATSF
jgi:hypothetical protein